MNIFNFDPAIFLTFLLIFMRVSLVVFMLPIFATDWLPGQVKAALALLITLAIWSYVPVPATGLPGHPFAIVLMIAGEVIIGLVLALAVNCFFAGIQCGGEILAMQMGFSMITLADPLSGNNTGLIAHFLYMVATLTFLALNGHLLMLQAFAQTFTLVPAGQLVLRGPLMTELIGMVGMVFVFAVRIAAPVMAILMLAEVALGLMNRAAPQIPVMEVGFPLKIALGFFFIGFLLLIMTEEARRFTAGMDGLFYNLLRSMAR